MAPGRGVGAAPMKVVICAGPPTCGKTTVLRQALKKLVAKKRRPAYIKIDVQFADEDALIGRELAIPVKKLYSGELCPDHAGVLVLAEAMDWAKKEGAEILVVETAGLCMRCAPYVSGALAVAVLEATSGMNLPRKVGPMLSLADIAVVTKIDLISQAEREVFRAGVHAAAPRVFITEANALHAIGIDPLVARIEKTRDIRPPFNLRGNPPVGTCTICAGKKTVGWENHFGIVRALTGGLVYRGE
jgi:Ni2+-binding GTPase involved in maturation of urease and hydrogenase